MILGDNDSDKLGWRLASPRLNRYIKLAQHEIERITGKKEDPQIIANALDFISNLSQQLPSL